MLIGEIARVELRLRLLEAKIDEGRGTDFDLAVMGGLRSQLRLMLASVDAMNRGAHKPAASKDHDYSAFVKGMAERVTP